MKSTSTFLTKDVQCIKGNGCNIQFFLQLKYLSTFSDNCQIIVVVVIDILI